MLIIKWGLCLRQKMGFLVALALLEVCSLIFLLSTKGKKNSIRIIWGQLKVKKPENCELGSWKSTPHMVKIPPLEKYRCESKQLER